MLIVIHSVDTPRHRSSSQKQEHKILVRDGTQIRPRGGDEGPPKRPFAVICGHEFMLRPDLRICCERAHSFLGSGDLIRGLLI
jgi:hypothetical protein